MGPRNLSETEKREVTEAIDRTLLGDYMGRIPPEMRAQIERAVVDTLEGLLETNMKDWEPQVERVVNLQFESYITEEIRQGALRAVLQAVGRTITIRRISA